MSQSPQMQESRAENISSRSEMNKLSRKKTATLTRNRDEHYPSRVRMGHLSLGYARPVSSILTTIIVRRRSRTNFHFGGTNIMPINIISEIQAGTLPDINTTQLFLMDVERFLDALPREPLFDLVVTSPPYNIGKEYENQIPLADYVAWQKRIIEKIYPRLKDNGSICWQVGNYVENGSITPLDIELAPIFKELNLHLRNRIIWHFGHGLHNKNRFSGRYEVIMWYTKSDTYTFNLDDVRVPAKYPGNKKRLVRMHLEEGRTIKSLSEEYQVSENGIGYWLKKYREECSKNPAAQEEYDLMKENLRLRKELEEAKKENEFLKKAAAFFAREID